MFSTKYIWARVLTWGLASVMLTSFVAQRTQAQVLYGSIVGTVMDASNAVVSGATVRITHRETNQSRESITNDVGQYSFRTIPTGTYDASITKGGFETTNLRGVVVTLNSVVRVDAAMQVGAVTESVQVAAQGAALQTERAEVRSEMTTKTLQSHETELPARHPDW